MNISELFEKQLDREINGVVKADQEDDATVYQELNEYIVTNELEKHFRAFFESYTTPSSDPSIANRVGIWISGFFGSGKSHFLKTLSYILANKLSHDASGQPIHAVDFFDDSKIRDAMIRADVDKAAAQPADVILFNIDSKASSNDDGNSILNVFLRVFNEQLGFSGDHPHIAHMERHLVEKGVYENFIQSFKESSGVEWSKERDGYQFYQDDIEKALAKALHMSDEAAHKWFESSEETFSVSVEKFCQWVKEYLDTKAEEHRVLFLADEVGQFIGSDTKLMLTLQTITENLGTMCAGRAWIIVTSQADMDAVLGEMSSTKANDFSKIAGRFKTRLSLSSSNADEVIQKRLLKKTPAAEAELRKEFEKKGDILKNQISFDRTGPTLKNFDGPESFVNNYPFAPYHFQLVQKVFEEIRKVGATGAHLAYGERSMLDAFQMAAKAISDQDIGVLVPMYRFYDSVEGFLDTAVKRTIDQAEENATLDEFDVQILRTLFMIRYVDLVKGTIENLVTLSIEQIDAGKLKLRQQIEDSVQRLEKESLITRNGDEFVFLTNEERDITQKIKATDIEGAEENKELGNLIYKDLLRDVNKYRYSVNKMDYNVGRFLDGHSLDGRQESDLRFEVLSPLDVEYAQYSEAGCVNKSSEGDGVTLLKLPDDKQFFTELRTWIKTNKFIRLNDDRSQADLTRILADRGRENQERKKRLRMMLEALLQNADIYSLGQKLDLPGRNITTQYDEACRYLLENTFSKLSYLKVLQSEPLRELKAVLSADDIGQLGLALDAEEGNPQATKEVEEFIKLSTSGNERILISDIVDRFSKRPFGWPDTEILLIVSRLAVAGRISFQRDGGTLPANQAFEPLQNSRERRKVSVIRKRQSDDTTIKQARDLTKDLFSSMGPATEKELFEFYQQNLTTWLDNLKSYKAKVEVGHFPGKPVIESAVLTLERLLSTEDSFDFFKQVLEKKAEHLDLEEDYRDLKEFFTNQLGAWQQLQQSLQHFDINVQALEKDAQASVALGQLREIDKMPSPYNALHKVSGLVSTIQKVNEEQLKEKRTHAINRVEEKIKQLEAEITNSGISTPELSNKLLRPLQVIKEKIGTEASIATIYMAQSQTAPDCLDDGLLELEEAIHADLLHKRAAEDAAAKDEGEADPNRVKEPTPVAPKPVVEVAASVIFNQVSSSAYIDSQADVDTFIEALREKLEEAIAAEKRVRLR